MKGAFVLSTPRSGSTMFRWVLDTHPEVACPAELYLSRVIEFFEQLVRYTSAASIMDEAARDKFVIEETRRVVTDQVERFAKDNKKTVWCDKSPTFTVLHIDRIFATFPEARYFCLYRNCLDNVHSCLDIGRHGYKLPGVAPYISRTPENIVDALVRFWCDVTEKELAFEKAHPELCLRVRYEDLVKDPKAMAPKKIFAHLGLDSPPDLFDKMFKQFHAPGFGDPKIHLKKSIEDETGKGALVPHTLVTNQVRNRADGLLAKLGYPPLGVYPKKEEDDPVTAQINALFDKTVPERLRKIGVRNLVATCKFVIGDGVNTRHWIVDLTGVEPKVVAGDGPSTVQIVASPDVMVEIATKRLNPVTAREDGRMKIIGDQGLGFSFYRMLFLDEG